MNDRLDYLLSVEMDDELEPAEREELDRLLMAHPEAGRRRGRLESVDTLIRTIATQPGVGEVEGSAAETDAMEADLDRRWASLQESLGRPDPMPTVEASGRRRASARWAPALAAAAAAAVAAFLVLPRVLPGGSFLESASVPSRSSLDTEPGTRGGVRQDASAEAWSGVDDPIVLAVVFELDDEDDSIEILDPVSAEDLEIIERLELLEFLAARQTEGRG